MTPASTSSVLAGRTRTASSRLTKLDKRRQKTLELLKQLNGDASPAALGKLDPAARLAAFAPPPTILPATDILFDAWALTTISGKLPGRPPVEPYLHGINDWQAPETYVAWREERREVITGDLLERHKPEDLLEDYPSSRTNCCGTEATACSRIFRRSPLSIPTPPRGSWTCEIV